MGTSADRLVEDVRIDGMANDLVPIPIDGIAIDGDGSIAVAQNQDYRVSFFSSDGASLGHLGRRGEGPREFANIKSLGWLGDTLWVWDARLARATLIGPGQELVRVMTPRLSHEFNPSSTGPLVFRAYGPWAFYSDGSMLALGAIEGAESVSALVHVSHNGTPITVVAHLERKDDVRTVTTSDGTIIDGDLFPLGPHYAGSPDGRLVAVLRTHLEAEHDPGTLSVTLIDTAADTILHRYLPIEGSPLPRRVADSAIATVATRMAERNPRHAAEFRRKVYVPPIYPPVTRVVLSHEGHIWVQLHDHGDARRFLVVDPSTEVVRRVTVPAPVDVVAIRDNAVWALERDMYDVQSIVRYRHPGDPSAQR